MNIIEQTFLYNRKWQDLAHKDFECDVNLYPAKLIYLNLDPPDIVSRYRYPQSQMV